AIRKPIMSSLHGFWSIGGFAAAAFSWVVLDRFGTYGHLGGALAIGAMRGASRHLCPRRA
ncbi:hypothetical protein J8J20_25595, partial [Mycobacterium tuberculosis]|nr:hypothetical protein [Mycobacterium tuberculosis]